MILEKWSLREVFSKSFELSLKSRVMDFHRIQSVSSRVYSLEYIPEYLDLHESQIPDHNVVLKKTFLLFFGKVSIRFHPAIQDEIW